VSCGGRGVTLGRMTPWCLAALFVAAPIVARADVPQVVVDAMKDRSVALLGANGAVLSTGVLVGSSAEELVVRVADGKLEVVRRSDVVEMRGAEVGSPPPVVTQDSEFVLRIRATREAAAEAVRAAVVARNGKIRSEDADRIEAAWRYGINAFGLRVTVTLTDGGTGEVIASFRGHFVDAFDTTGVAKARAREVIAAVRSRLEAP
jgi:hypothetical protein